MTHESKAVEGLHLRHLTINKIAATVIDHHLRKHGQDMPRSPGRLLRWCPPTVSASLRQATRRGRCRQKPNFIRVLTAVSADVLGRCRRGDQPTSTSRFVARRHRWRGLAVLNAMRVGDGVSYCEILTDATSGRSARLFTTAWFPATIVVAMRGRPLVDVISHPGLGELGLGILGADNAADGQTLLGPDGPTIGTSVEPSDASTSIVPFDQFREELPHLFPEKT